VYRPLARVTVAAFRPVRGFRSSIWTPSIPRPVSSVTVPVSAPVVTPWAWTPSGRTANASAAAALTSERKLNMYDSLWEERCD
jgi:hypothetical protein